MQNLIINHQPISLQELKDKFRGFKNEVERGQEPQQLLTQIYTILKQANENPQETIYSNAELKKYFFEEFLGGISKRISQVKSTNDTYLKIVADIVMLLAEFFVQEIERDNADMADAMRCIFDSSSDLYQYNFQQQDNYIQSSNSSAILDKLNPEEREWRLSLKVGSKLDAIKVEPKYGLKTWNKAVIVQVIGDGSYFEVNFENDNNLVARDLTVHSPEIAAYGTMSEDDEWRTALQIGDLIDGFDSTKFWYSSTIVAKETRFEDDKEVPYLRVGFRVYEEEGNKEDQENGLKYYGWSDKFDEWIPAFNPRIQKYQSLAKVWQQNTNLNNYDELVDDHMDILLYSKHVIKPVFAVERTRCSSTLLVQFLNQFGELGGFQLILDKINKHNNSTNTAANDQDAIGLDVVFYYLDCLANCTVMYNKVFIKEYLPQLDAAIKNKVLTANDQQIRNVKKDRIDGIVQCLTGSLWTRLKSPQQREQDKNLFNLDIGCIFLKHYFFERRIDGAKYIQEVCKNANLLSYSTNTDTIMNSKNKQQQMQFIYHVIELLKQRSVLKYIFSKEHAHLQLVQRSEELLKLFISQTALTQEELQLIWSSSNVDEGIKLELYKVLNDLSLRLWADDITFIITQLSLKPVNTIINEEIELVHELAKRSRNSQSTYGHLILEYLWNIITDSSNKADKSLVNQAAIAFSDIIKNWDDVQKLKYVEKLIANLKQNKEAFLSIKMLAKISREFIPTIKPASDDLMSMSDNIDDNKEQQQPIVDGKEIPSFKTKSAFLEYICATYGLQEAIFDNLTYYMDHVNQVINRKLAIDPQFEVNALAEKCILDKFIHSEQISERLEFLKYMGCSTNIGVNNLILTSLWKELVLTSQLQQDQEYFYRWLRECCDQSVLDKCNICINNLILFFREKMTKETKAFNFITLEGFNCIQSFFVLLNETTFKLVKLNNQGQNNLVQKYTSVSNTNGGVYNSYSFSNNKGGSQSNDPEDLEIQVLVHPNYLEGVEGLWDIAIDSNDRIVSERATALLIKLHTNVSFELEAQVPEFESAFIDKCIDHINMELDKINSRTEQPKEEFQNVEKYISAFASSALLQKILPAEEKKILRYLSLLRELIRNSEKDGTYGLKPHSALNKGEYLHTIQIQNQLKNGVKYPSKIEIGCHSNTTLWELRKMIGERVARIPTEDGSSYLQDVSCHPASIRLYRFSGTIDIKEQDNGKTLAELNFKPNESLSAFKKNIYNSIKQPLLSPDGNDLSFRAKQIFTEWFKIYSVEDPDNPGVRIMNPKTCAQFTRSCTEDNCSEDDNRVTKLFALYDGDQDNKIQESEFLYFYLESCKGKEDLVRHNLYSHGYRYDLRKQPYDGLDENMMQIRPNIQEMPRYKIANKPEHFETIFRLLDKQGELSQQAWGLIKTLATNPTLYQTVLKLDKNPEFQWQQIFNSESIYKMLYSLQIIESFLEEENASLDISSVEGQLKKDWIQRFLSTGGFQEMLKLFHHSLNKLSEVQSDSLSKFEKSLLEFMLKLIKIFMMAAFSASQVNAIDVVALVRRQSSFKEEELAEQKRQQDQEMAKQDNDDIEYKTPAKQVKGEFVGIGTGPQDEVYLPEVTQEFLFGDGDKQDKHHQEQYVKKEHKTEEKVEKAFEESKRFAELSSIMRETGLGDEILDQIDFKQLQSQILEIVCLIMSKKEINIEDKQIVENALSLWVASLIRQEDLIDEFYKYEISEEKAENQNVIKSAEQFIITGLYCYKNYRVRDEFFNTFITICSKIKKNKGRLPLFYCLDILKNNFPREDYFYTTRECLQFFNLFGALVDEYFKSQSELLFEKEAIDCYELLREVVLKLKKHETKEKKGSLLEDKVLIGYLTLIEKLMVNLSKQDKNKALKVLEETDFLQEIFYEDLFFNASKTQSKTENKCKTKEARPPAYSLLLKYIEIMEPKELAEFLEDNLLKLIENLPKQKKWKYIPAEHSKSTNFSGIINLGCTCYMNSMLQQFFMVPAFRHQLLRAVDTSPVDMVEYKGMKIDDSLLRQLQKMYGYLEISEKHAYDPTEFCFSFKDFDGCPTNTALQQDAQEFLNIFFDRIEEQLKPTSQKHLLKGVFGGKVCSQLICQSCGNVRNILEDFYNLSLPVKDRKGLEESLDKMTEGSLINDYQCENCNQRVDVFKRSLVAETPNVLIVHLQRIVFNFDTFQNDKVNTRFEFPNVLNLKEYSFKSVMTAEERPQEMLYSDLTKHLMEADDKEFIYKLVGVILHVGTAEHGHYYSLINTKRGKDEPEEDKQEWEQTEKDPWKVFEDDKIKNYTFNELKLDSFGGNSQANMADNEINAYLTNSDGQSFGKNAYMLVYERKKKNPLSEVVLEPPFVDNLSEGQNKQDTTTQASELNTALDCANTATSRDVTITSKSEDMELPPQIQYPQQKQVDFRKVEPYVPEWIKSMVAQDNTEFLINKHIYHEQFFNLARSIFKHVSNILMTQHRYSLEYSQYFTKLKKVTLKLIKILMFDQLSIFFHNIQMSDIASSFGSIIQFCDSHYSLTRGDDSLLLDFINEAYLNDNCAHFFNIMFYCPDKTSRYYIGKMTSALINKVFSIYEQAEDKEAPKLNALIIATKLLLFKFVKTMATQECQKNWTRLENYIKMIQEIGLGGRTQADYFLTHFDIVVELIDFMLGNNSPLAMLQSERRPNMGAGQTNPPFEPIVALVCYFVRFSMTPQMREERHEWDPINNPPPQTLLGYNILTDQDKQERYILSEQARQFFMHQDFIDKVLKEGYECEEFGKALAHFCYKDEKFTKKVSKLILNGISRNDYEKVKNYLDVVNQVALVKDDFQRSRLEWIFGYGSLNSHCQTMINPTHDLSQLPRIGIQILSHISDDVYSFKSSLIYDSSDDALLHLLWRYKGRMDTYTVSCLFSLVGLIASDEKIAEYFSELPGPSYALARYTDWIKPYLLEQLAEARKGYHGSMSAGKEETIVKCLSLFEIYEKYTAKKDKIVNETIENNSPEVQLVSSYKKQSASQKEPDHYPNYQRDTVEFGNNAMDIDNEDEEENIGNLIAQSNRQQAIVVAPLVVEESPQKNTVTQYQDVQVIKCLPQPYIIVECVGEQVKRAQNFDGVVLTISKLACLYTLSKPTGSSNQSVPPSMLKRSQYPYGGDNKPVKHINTAAVREQELQNQCINNYFSSKKFSHNNNHQVDKTNDGGQNQNNVNPYQENQIEQESYQIQVIDDDNKQWEQIDRMNVSDIDNEEEGYTQDQEENNNNHANKDENHSMYANNEIQDRNTSVTNNNNEASNDDKPMEEQSFKIRVIEDGQDLNAFDAEMNNEEIEGEAPVIEEESGSTQVNWPNEVILCPDLVYRFYVLNNKNAPVKVHLKLKLNDDSLPPNLSWPRGGVKVVVYPQQTKTIIMLPKIRVESSGEDSDLADGDDIAEVDKLSMEFLWKIKGREIISGTNYNNNITTSSDYNQKVGGVSGVPPIKINAPNEADQYLSNIIDGQIPSDFSQYAEGQTVDPPTNAETAVVGEQVEAPAEEALEIPKGKKACLQCTVFNEETETSCWVCGGNTFQSSNK